MRCPCGSSELMFCCTPFRRLTPKRCSLHPSQAVFAHSWLPRHRSLRADFGRRPCRGALPDTSSCNPGYSFSTFHYCSDRSLGILHRRPTFAGDSLPCGGVDTPRRHKRAGRGEIGMLGIPTHNTDRSLFSWKQRAGILRGTGMRDSLWWAAVPARQWFRRTRVYGNVIRRIEETRSTGSARLRVVEIALSVPVSTSHDAAQQLPAAERVQWCHGNTG
jgi:hypothetical protein